MGLTKPRAHQFQDLPVKASCRAVSTTNVTLSGGAPSVVDGVSLAINDRILVNGQSATSQNGIYKVSVVGTGANGTWVRPYDTDETGELLAGMLVMVTEGLSYDNAQWKLITNGTIVVEHLTYYLN
jgi:hypothetical protein